MAKRGFPITKAMREERRKKAEARQAEYDKLTLEQKLAKLPETGAKKQRAKLEAALEKSKAKITEKATEVSTASAKKPAKTGKKQ